MAVIALDLGGTKLAWGLFSSAGRLLETGMDLLPAGHGSGVGKLMANAIGYLRGRCSVNDPVTGIGICVPGVWRPATRTVWAPNIIGWDDYPLWDEINLVAEGVDLKIDSDRSCCILGEAWLGAAMNCRDAIFVTVGTGIGAGVMSDRQILRGAQGIAGAIGWMALQGPYRQDYSQCGCYEQYASGEGIAKSARAMLRANPAYAGALAAIPEDRLCASDVFTAYRGGDPLARQIMEQVVRFWGMATANLVSIFNPDKIVFGGGLFGPAVAFLDQIYEEAKQWAQPGSMRHVTLVPSQLGADAALYGAAALFFTSSQSV